MESNLGFGGAAPSGGARLSTQEVWQKVSDMAGQVRALATLHTSLHNALFATLASPMHLGTLHTSILEHSHMKITCQMRVSPPLTLEHAPNSIDRGRLSKF